MFQDVLDTQNYGRDTIRQMIISTPIFDDSGKIRNILAVVRPLDRLNQLYYQATQAESVSSISGLRASPPVKGSAVIAESPAMRAALSTAGHRGRRGLGGADLRGVGHRQRGCGPVHPRRQPPFRQAPGGDQLRLPAGKPAGGGTLRL